MGRKKPALYYEDFKKSALCEDTIMIFSQFFGSIALVCTKYIPEMSFARFACLLSPFNLESEQKKMVSYYSMVCLINLFSNQHKMYQIWSLSG